MFKKNIANTKDKILHNSSGFTLLEITIAIFIIVIGMMGILSLANQNVQVEVVNKNSVIASQLAQEGLESVRNKRDMNWMQGGDWEHSTSSGSRLDILPGGSSGSGNPLNYTVDAATGLINTNVPSGINDAAAKLYLNAGGFYTHNATATSTPFSRLITVGNENTASTSVTCLVQWKKGTNTYNFSAQTILYNWK